MLAGRHTQAGDATDQWRYQPNAAIVWPTQCFSWLIVVNCQR